MKTKRQTRAEKFEAQMRAAGLWSYWSGSISQSLLESHAREQARAADMAAGDATDYANLRAEADHD